MFKRIVFMGSPDFAVPVLNTLIESNGIIGIVTQPDRPAGRGRHLIQCVVKKEALVKKLPVFQPNNVNELDSIQYIKEWKPDLIVVAAYGQILKPSILEIPECGCINVHASLLPRWRGASPVQAAILAGDSVSGVTIIKMDEGMDSGPILAQRAVDLSANETSQTLSIKLSLLGANLLQEILPDYFSGNISSSDQDTNKVTKAPLLRKIDGKLEFNKSAVEIERQVRAFHPWPGNFMEFNGQPLKVLRVRIDSIVHANPWQRLIVNNLPVIGTNCDCVILEVVQPAGKNVMSGADFLRGARNWITI